MERFLKKYVIVIRVFDSSIFLTLFFGRYLGLETHLYSLMFIKVLSPIVFSVMLDFANSDSTFMECILTGGVIWVTPKG